MCHDVHWRPNALRYVVRYPGDRFRELRRMLAGVPDRGERRRYVHRGRVFDHVSQRLPFVRHDVRRQRQPCHLRLDVRPLPRARERSRDLRQRSLRHRVRLGVPCVRRTVRSQCRRHALRCELCRVPDRPGGDRRMRRNGRMRTAMHARVRRLRFESDDRVRDTAGRKRVELRRVRKRMHGRSVLHAHRSLCVSGLHVRRPVRERLYRSGELRKLRRVLCGGTDLHEWSVHRAMRGRGSAVRGRSVSQYTHRPDELRGVRASVHVV